MIVEEKKVFFIVVQLFTMYLRPSLTSPHKPISRPFTGVSAVVLGPAYMSGGTANPTRAAYCWLSTFTSAKAQA